MTDNIISNVSGIALHINAIRKADWEKELAVGFLAQSIGLVWDKPMMAFIAAGEDTLSYPFTIADMFSPRAYENGQPVSAGSFAKACYEAIGTEFGVEGGMQAKDKVAFKRARRLAGAYEVLGVDVQWHETKGVSLPAEVVFELTKMEDVKIEAEDGTPMVVPTEVLTTLGKELVERVQGNADMFGDTLSDADALAKAKEMRVFANGKEHPILKVKTPPASQLADKFAKPLTEAGCDNWKERNPQQAKEKVSSFDASLDFMLKCMKDVLNPEADEAPFTPSVELETKLGDLGEAIMAFLSTTNPDVGEA